MTTRVFGGWESAASMVHLKALVYRSLTTGLCQPPGGATAEAASAGPQVLGSYSCTGVAAFSTGSTMRQASSDRKTPPKPPPMMTTRVFGGWESAASMVHLKALVYRSLTTGLCQPPGGATAEAASAGPQVLGSYSCTGVAAFSTGSTMRQAS